jgi:parallel beta-helix repeat protein
VAFGAIGNRDGSYSGNTVQNTGASRHGMHIGHYGSAAELEINPTVQNNTITDVGGDGIVIVAQGGLVSTNTVTRAGASGIVLSGYQSIYTTNTVLEGNQVSRCTWHGIQSDMFPGEYTSGVTVRNNVVFENNGSGIYAVNTRSWLVEGNTARDNDLDNVPNAEGITVQSSRDLVIRNNVLADTRTGSARTQNNGIKIVGYGGSSSAPDVYNVEVSGNTVTNHSHQGIFVGGAPGGYLDLVNVTRNTISGNTLCGLEVAEDANTRCSVTRFRQSQNTFSNNGGGTFCDLRPRIPGCRR